jgi:GNAT superfamily N-acetyltransferase
MSFTVEPVTSNDLVEWTNVHFQAFYPLLTVLWTSPPSPRGMELLAENRRPAIDSPDSHAFKCVDTATGRIAGVAYWTVYDKERTPQEVEETLSESQESPEVNAETHINLEARRTFMANIFRSRREILGAQPAVVLKSLTVHPDYQRRGVGTMLMKWGVDEADRCVHSTQKSLTDMKRLGLIGYLESSKFGKGLYERFGYKPVRTIYFDPKPFGGTDIDIHEVRSQLWLLLALTCPRRWFGSQLQSQ